jgi:predicted nucleotidyltransferase
VTLPTEFLVYIAELLERLGIPYHVGGSVASSAHGMYRASADIDFVIDPTRDQLEALARALGQSSMSAVRRLRHSPDGHVQRHS